MPEGHATYEEAADEATLAAEEAALLAAETALLAPEAAEEPLALPPQVLCWLLKIKSARSVSCA